MTVTPFFFQVHW